MIISEKKAFRQAYEKDAEIRSGITITAYRLRFLTQWIHTRYMYLRCSSRNKKKKKKRNIIEYDKYKHGYNKRLKVHTVLKRSPELLYIRKHEINYR